MLRNSVPSCSVLYVKPVYQTKQLLGVRNVTHSFLPSLAQCARWVRQSRTTPAMLWTFSICLQLGALSLAAPLARSGTGPRNKLLLISFDGFRWDYDRDVDTPHLDAMAAEGVKAPYVTPPFLTITSPTHFTLLTGNPPVSIAASKGQY